MGSGTQTQGGVLVNAVQMLDFEQRGAQKIEAPLPEIAEK